MRFRVIQDVLAWAPGATALHGLAPLAIEACAGFLGHLGGVSHHQVPTLASVRFLSRAEISSKPRPYLELVAGRCCRIS